MAEVGANQEVASIESNGSKMFATAITLLKQEGRPVRHFWFWKRKKAVFKIPSDGELKEVVIWVNNNSDNLDQAESLRISIGGVNGEHLMINNTLGETGKNTYKVYGERVTDPAGWTLDNSPGGDKRTKDVLKTLLDIKSEVNAKEPMPAGNLTITKPQPSPAGT